ncbi:hypothetical protein F5B22DRAFT_578193 [Xylaria bambusicola]|uniref:uncharacterized protein n=1 Tax=Xylaria bambusicola TaxID=326684 RepID=UPI00200797C5|nr:uncharacterized protein F5B22DRAFT_578193 [Xylaria bambusicola]KAI0503013.1 hypothetical protein F5B22DRAFT_578193 [Xylaria bambusicola]
MFSRNQGAYHAPLPGPRRGAVPPTPGPGGRGSWPTPKRMIWTGAFAAVTIVGTIYGAGLKTQQEYRAEKKQILETSIEERISALEARRAQLVRQKQPLEKKREELQLRIEKQNQATDTRS